MNPNPIRQISPDEPSVPMRTGGGTAVALLSALIGAILGAMIGVAVATDNYVGGVIGAALGAIIGWLIGKAVAAAGRRKAAARAGAVARASEPVPKRREGDLSDVSRTRRTDPAASSASVQAADRTDRSEVRVPLVEERLEVDKRELEAGLVRLRKVVTTEVVHMPVELRREEIIVEKVEPGEATSGSATHGDVHAFEHQKGDEIVIPLVKEEAVIQKESKVFSEVHVHKITRTETQNVQEVVRKEQVELEQPGEGGRKV